MQKIDTYKKCYAEYAIVLGNTFVDRPLHV